MSLDWSKLQTTPDPSAMARVRASLQESLQQPSFAPWRETLTKTALFLTGSTALLLAATLALGQWNLPLLGLRSTTLSLLVIVQVVSCAVLIAPPKRKLNLAFAAMLVLTMLGLVVFRYDGHSSTTPPWVCTLSHLSLSVVPLLLTRSLLRQAAVTAYRGIASGALAGTLGATLGEFLCGQNAEHVALFHLPAWILAIGVGLFSSRNLRVESYAP